jgi:hypothetical protein
MVDGGCQAGYADKFSRVGARSTAHAQEAEAQSQTWRAGDCCVPCSALKPAVTQLPSRQMQPNQLRRSAMAVHATAQLPSLTCLPVRAFQYRSSRSALYDWTTLLSTHQSIPLTVELWPVQRAMRA